MTIAEGYETMVDISLRGHLKQNTGNMMKIRMRHVGAIEGRRVLGGQHKKRDFLSSQHYTLGTELFCLDS